MRKSLTIFLQIVVVLVGIGALVFLLGEPHLEGRNAGATLFEIYFNDPFLAYAYTASIPFFIALYQAFKLLGYARQNEIVSQRSLKALQTIKYSAITILGFILSAEAYLFIVRPGDDIAGGVFMGLLVIVASGTVASVATRFEQSLQNKIKV